MKRILITGSNSYIGTSFEKYIKQFGANYQVDTIDMIDGSWRKKSFAEYDTVFHVAGIAHSDTGKISAEREKLYRSINTDLTIETATKAKIDGVKQFIFMSSAIVYGNSAPLGKQKIITRETPVSPANYYGDSKVQAEKGICLLQDNEFNVVILRPPMIYGKGSKGNYPILSKLAIRMPIFPKVNNFRSMLYVENFCEFVRLMIENNEKGIFYPQNKEYTNTSKMVEMIAQCHGKKIWITPIFNWGLYLIRPFVNIVDKAFGSLAYDMSISIYSNSEYRINSLEKSIEIVESEK